MMHTHTCSNILPWLFLFPVFFLFHQTLIRQQAVLSLQNRGTRLKRDVFHLSTVIMLPIRQDIFISCGRDVRPDSDDSCALRWRETIYCQVSGPIQAPQPSIFIRHVKRRTAFFPIGLPDIICSKRAGCH